MFDGFSDHQVISGSPSKVLSAFHPVELTLQLGLFDAKRCPGASRVGPWYLERWFSWMCYPLVMTVT